MTKTITTEKWGYRNNKPPEPKPEPFDLSGMVCKYSAKYDLNFWGKDEAEAQKRLDDHEATMRDRLATKVYFNGTSS